MKALIEALRLSLREDTLTAAESALLSAMKKLGNKPSPGDKNFYISSEKSLKKALKGSDAMDAAGDLILKGMLTRTTGPFGKIYAVTPSGMAAMGAKVPKAASAHAPAPASDEGDFQKTLATKGGTPKKASELKKGDMIGRDFDKEVDTVTRKSYGVRVRVTKKGVPGAGYWFFKTSQKVRVK